MQENSKGCGNRHIINYRACLSTFKGHFYFTLVRRGKVYRPAYCLRGDGGRAHNSPRPWGCFGNTLKQVQLLSIRGNTSKMSTLYIG